MVDTVADIYRYAATISTIEACNFIDFIIIQFYNNFKKVESNLIRNFLSSLKMTLRGRNM